MNIQIEDASAVDSEADVSETVVAEINITPLTDVFLVLLIIFMVTSTAIVESEITSRTGVKVALPKANAAGAVTKKRTDPILTVTKNNEVYLFSKKVDVANLEQEIRKALNDVGSETLLLRGDKNVFLGEAVDLMAIAKRAGAKNIAILTQTEQK
ncbi:MAG TPA: biopolymer transporter ExbD [Polyangia bacterium]|nr:biopolymer transporter ExbD [Polyangia bacterium]